MDNSTLSDVQLGEDSGIVGALIVAGVAVAGIAVGYVVKSVFGNKNTEKRLEELARIVAGMRPQAVNPTTINAAAAQA